MKRNIQQVEVAGNYRNSLPRIPILDQEDYENTDCQEDWVAAMAKHEAQYIAIAFNDFVIRIAHTATAQLMQPALARLAETIQRANILTTYPAKPDLQESQEIFLESLSIQVDQPVDSEVSDEFENVPF